MQIEITKQVSVKEVIDIELPYYYQIVSSSYGSSTTKSGKVDLKSFTEIQIQEFDSGMVVCSVHSEMGTPDEFSHVFEAEYMSKESEYITAKDKLYSVLAEL